MNNCKISVLKRMTNQDLINEYMGAGYREGNVAPCPHFAEGQQFLVDNPGALPEGFCGWAWSNIHKEIVAIMSGGDFRPWTKDPGVAIACCTDGFRPVVFKIERVA